MRSILLSKGHTALVDDDVYEDVSRFKWSLATCDGKFYARRLIYVDGKRKHLYLHRYIMNAPKGVKVDHKDRNGLNCCKDNMRLATDTQNSQNRSHEKSSRKFRSKYKGVTWYRSTQSKNPKYRDGCWMSRISYKGSQRSLGYFDCEEDAATMYNVAAQILFGEFALLNPI